MVLSIPGVLVSRDGSVREYVGHSNRMGTLFGHARREGSGWKAVCVACPTAYIDTTQRETARQLHAHWRAAPSDTHTWRRKGKADHV